ncbi:hypothetical protein ANO14919_068890 [Xylariales sp. No.14919]|nr:hypothetical protein ANO14919_068890 [Xylariales sp. No.14919]
MALEAGLCQGSRVTIERTHSSQTSPANMAEPSHDDAIYADIQHKRLSDGKNPSEMDSWESRFYGDEEFRKLVPKGFPSMAAMKAFWHNTGTFRTFEYLDWRLLEFYGTKIGYLENRLYELDVAESKKRIGPQTTQVPFNKNLADCCYRDSDPLYVAGALEANENMSQDEFINLRERLFAHYDHLSDKHHKVVCRLREARTFPRVHRRVHNQLFTTADEHHKLGGEAISHLRAIDETAYVSIDPVELLFQHIWHSTAPWMKKVFERFHRRNPLPGHDGSLTYGEVALRSLKVFYKALATILASLLVLVPTGILYLLDLSRWKSYGVIVIFSVVFSIAFILVEQRITHGVVGIVAYVAVLATVLENVT